jgi:hypothetical protein
MKTDAYGEGRRAARSAISAGVPRWGVLSPTSSVVQETDEIDQRTGLPVIVVHAPDALVPQQSEFLRGHNDEILAAISSGEITRDFRPLLMSRREIDSEFGQGSLGRLDLNTRRLTSLSGDIVVEIEVPKPRRGPPPRFARDRPSWIVLRRGENPLRRLLVYEGPIEVAVVRDGRVLVLRTDSHDLVYETETSQTLNRYPRRAR